MQCHECGNPRDADSQFCPWCFAFPAPGAAAAPPVAAPPVAAATAPPTPVAPPTRQIPFTPSSEPGYLTEPSSTTPNPFERRLAFGRDGGVGVMTAPAPTTARTTDLFGGHGPKRRVSSTLIAAGASALVLVLLGVAVVTLRSGGGQPADEAIVDATLAMATDDDVRAALQDVATAEAAHFKANGAYTSSAKELRKAAAKAPMAKGFDALRAGVVYVDASTPKGGEPAFYLVAKVASGGCVYLKGVPDGLSESSSATCVSGFAADYGKSPQQKRADAMVIKLADLGPGWVDAREDGRAELDFEMGPEFDVCLGRPTLTPTATAVGGGFVRSGPASSTAVIPFASVWPDDIVAQRDLALVEHPKLGSCLADSLRGEFYGDFVPYVFDRIALTVSDRGAMPGAPESRRVRLRPTMTLATGGQASFWMDLVFASRGRVEAVVMVLSFGTPPDDALTARLVTTTLDRA